MQVIIIQEAKFKLLSALTGVLFSQYFQKLSGQSFRGLREMSNAEISVSKSFIGRIFKFLDVLSEYL